MGPSLLWVFHHVLTVLLAALVLSVGVRLWKVWRGIRDRGFADLMCMQLVFSAAMLARLLLPPETLLHPNFHGMTFLEIPLCPPIGEPALLADKAGYGLGNYTFYHFLWAYLPRTVGTYFMVNRVLSAVTCVLLFLLVRLLGGSRVWAFSSGILLALLPGHIIPAASENGIVLCSFLAMAALVNWAGWLATRSPWLLLGAAGYLVWTVHSRVLVLAFPAAFVIVALARKWTNARSAGAGGAQRLQSPSPGEAGHSPGQAGGGEKRIPSPSFPVGEGRACPAKPWRSRVGGALACAALAFLLLAVPQYVHVLSGLGRDESRNVHAVNLLLMPLALLRPDRNLLLDPDVTPVFLPLAVVLGLIVLFRTDRRMGWSVLALTLGFGALYLFFSDHITSQLRYQYFTWPFYALTAGVLPAWLCGMVELKRGVASVPAGTPHRARLLRKASRIRLSACALTVLVVAAFSAPYVARVQARDAGAEEFSFIMDTLPKLPEGSVLLEPKPIDVPGFRTIAPLALPDFLLAENGLEAATADPEQMLGHRKDLPPWSPVSPPPSGGSTPSEARGEEGVAGSVPPLLVYIGLQAHSFFPGEEVGKYAPDYLRLKRFPWWKKVRLVPVETRTIGTKGYTPAEDLYIPTGEVEIGFYRVEPK